MAKLVDQITADDLLSTIREGSVKKEIIKKFRTSDEELAKMLLPLYRGGQMTKEEFKLI